MSTPGIHVAVHTDEVLLSTGAWMDFSQHINTLVLGGQLDEARVLWGSVFEVVHMGVDPSTPVLQSHDMPPIRRMLCCKTPYVRCETGRGGFQFPFIGTWARRAVFAQDGGAVAATWDRYHASPHGKLDLRRCTAQGMQWRTSSPQPPGEANRPSCVGFWRRVSERSQSYFFAQWLNGGCGNGATEFGTSPPFSCQSTRAPDAMRGDSSGCSWELLKLSSTSSLPSASCATCPGSRNAQGVEHTSATDAETSFPFVRCVAIAPVTMSRARVPSGAAAYKGRGATCCYPSCYEDLGEVCSRVICASQGASYLGSWSEEATLWLSRCQLRAAEDRGAIHPLPPCQVRFGSLVEAGGPNLWPPVLASSCGRNCLGHGIWPRALCCWGNSRSIGFCYRFGPSAASAGEGVSRKSTAWQWFWLCVLFQHQWGGEIGGWRFFSQPPGLVWEPWKKRNFFQLSLLLRQGAFVQSGCSNVEEVHNPPSASWWSAWADHEQSGWLDTGVHGCWNDKAFGPDFWGDVFRTENLSDQLSQEKVTHADNNHQCGADLCCLP